jgi:hypothetical protein
MAIYQSMQRVRFSSPDGYEKFKLLLGEVRNRLKMLPGFPHLTWWVHPKDPSWLSSVDSRPGNLPDCSYCCNQ